VQNSRTGWLYEPGDLPGFRARVMDLMGDDAKRRAFAAAAHASVQGRTWSVLGAELVGHYQAVTREPAVAPPPPVALSLGAAKPGS
jgi:phosphatidylinositol alpha 1,6-mannosyltransferase